MHYLVLVLGFICLVKGADTLVEGASSIAKKIGLSSLVIGLTLVAMGTSAPELAVSLTGALNGANGITVGNVVGSNIFNILVIAGSVAIFYPLKLDQGMLKYGLPFFIGSAGLTVLFALDGAFSRIEGAIYLILTGLYTWLLIKGGKVETVEGSESSEEADQIREMSWLKSIVFTVAGLGLVLLGGNFVVDSATALAKSWGWSDSLIGLTIVAVGTSLPELVTSIVSARKGQVDIALGNAIGSSILNLLFILGASAFILPITLSEGMNVDIWLLMGVTMLMSVFVFMKRELSRVEGATLTLIYIAYTIYLMQGI